MNIYETYLSALLSQATYALDLEDNLSGNDLVLRLTEKEAGMQNDPLDFENESNLIDSGQVAIAWQLLDIKKSNYFGIFYKIRMSIKHPISMF